MWGCVMTPALALVVERETAIDSFKKEKFYTVELDCGFSAVSDPDGREKGSGKTESCLCRPARHCPKCGEKAAYCQPTEAV